MENTALGFVAVMEHVFVVWFKTLVSFLHLFIACFCFYVDHNNLGVNIFSTFKVRLKNSTITHSVGMINVIIIC